MKTTYVYDKDLEKMIEYVPASKQKIGILPKELTTREKTRVDIFKGYRQMEDSGKWTSKFSKKQVERIWNRPAYERTRIEH